MPIAFAPAMAFLLLTTKHAFARLRNSPSMANVSNTVPPTAVLTAKFAIVTNLSLLADQFALVKLRSSTLTANV